MLKNSDISADFRLLAKKLFSNKENKKLGWIVQREGSRKGEGLTEMEL